MLLTTVSLAQRLVLYAFASSYDEDRCAYHFSVGALLTPPLLRRQVCGDGGRQTRDEQSAAHEPADGHRATGAVRTRVGFFCGHVGRAVDARTGRAQSRQ